MGPHLAFFASPDPRKQQQSLPNSKWVAKTLNHWQAKAAARFMYAADTQHTPLAAKWLKRTRERPAN
jgi:hypothetical protein